MNTFLDTVVMVLFVLFMIFIFRGYHHQKFVQREKEAKEKEEAETNFKQTSEHSE